MSIKKKNDKTVTLGAVYLIIMITLIVGVLAGYLIAHLTI